MRVWSVLVAGGCVAPVEPTSWGEVDGADLLVDHPEEAFAERVRPLAVPAARLVPDGPRLDPTSSWPPAELVVVDPTPWPRVSVQAGDVQVLLYVERGALEPRIVADAWGTGRYGDGRVRLQTGIGVTRDEEDGEGRARVLVELDELTVEAWLPAYAVDEVWREDEARVAPVPPPEGPLRTLVEGASIVDRPGGDPLATTGLERAVTVVGGDEEDAWRPVVLDEGEVRVEGWAHADDLDERVVLWGRSRCGGAWGSSGYGRVGFHPSAIVPVGTLLYAGPGGPVVARALRDLSVPLEALEIGAEVVRATPLGEVALWAAPEDVVPGATGDEDVLLAAP